MRGQKKKKGFFKRLFNTLVALFCLIVVAVVGTCVFAYFKYDINAIGVVTSVKDINNFTERSLNLNNKFTDFNYNTAKLKIENHDFSENVIYFTDCEVGAVVNNTLQTNNNSGYNFSLLELTFAESSEENAIINLNFVIKLETKEIKEQLNKFPANLVTNKMADSLYLTANVDVVSAEEGYAVNYKSLIVNNVNAENTENLFRLLNLFSKDLEVKLFTETLAQQIVNAIIGKESSIFANLKSFGAESYLFNTIDNKTHFAVYSYSLDEERIITYNNTKGATNTNKEIYTLKDGVITLNNLELNGYNFKGWYNGETKVETIDATQMQNYILEARWETIIYAITYNLKGGTVTGENPTTYTIETPTFTLVNPTKEDDNFVAWSGTGLMEETDTVTIAIGSTGNLEFTAHYEFDKVFVTYNVDGLNVYTHEYDSGTVLTEEMSNEIYQSEEAGMVGYEVETWYLNSAQTDEYVFGSLIKRDFTLYGNSNYFVESPLTPEYLAKFDSAISSGVLRVQNHQEMVAFAFYVEFFAIERNQTPELDLSAYIAKTSNSIMGEMLLAIQEARNSSPYQSGADVMRASNGVLGELWVSDTIAGVYATQTINAEGTLYEQQGVAPILAFEDTRDDEFNGFNILNVTNTITVENSEQLVCALEMGFNPVCVPDSRAEVVYNKAKGVLQDICNDNMSNADKVYAIYTWLINNVQYDNKAYDLYINSGLTAEQSRAYDSWFAEGVFNNGKAVCEGIAKAFVIMAKLENIPCVYVTGDGHAWNRVYVNGAWYGVDATHGNSMSSQYEQELVTFTQFLFTDSYKTSTGYTSTDHTDIVANTTFNFYADYAKFTQGSNNFDLHINSTTEFTYLVSYIKINEPVVGMVYTLEITLANSVELSNLAVIARNAGLNVETSYCYQRVTTTGETAYMLVIYNPQQ